jgi:beta-lactamase class D
MKITRTFVPLLLLSQSIFAQSNATADFSKQFKKHNVEGCFVLFNKTADAIMWYNPKTCDSIYLPASTFKIPNSLIALEEGVIKDTLQVVRWDSTVYPVKSWNQDQTLSSAMRYSCVWFYIRIAEHLGIKMYERYLPLFKYGNMKIGNPQNSFWLSGDIRISANQQIEFLRAMYEYRLPISKRSVDIVKKSIVLERGSGYVLSGKTGGTDIDEHRSIMWFVGYLERGGDGFYYALNFITNDFNTGKQIRFELLKDILKELKLVE